MTTNDRQNFIAARDKAADIYRENSNLLAQFCNNTTDQLAIILVTAALAFLAIITTSLGDSKLLGTLPTCPKKIMMVCIGLFVVSVILGIIALAFEIKHLHTTYIQHNDIVDEILRSKGWDDLQRVQDTKIKKLQKDNKNVGFSFIIFQCISFILGIVVASLYVGMLLFCS